MSSARFGVKKKKIQQILKDGQKITYKIKDTKIHLVYTGINTKTGSRIKKIQNIIENNTFCLTYGDDLKKINIKQLINFHEQKNKMVTMTVTQPKPRFGIVKIKKDQVVEINEKSIKDAEEQIHNLTK